MKPGLPRMTRILDTRIEYERRLTQITRCSCGSHSVLAQADDWKQEIICAQGLPLCSVHYTHRQFYPDRRYADGVSAFNLWRLSTLLPAYIGRYL